MSLFDHNLYLPTYFHCDTYAYIVSFQFHAVTPFELNFKVTYTTNTSVSYILLVQKFLLISAVWKRG